jgi:thiamine biosynthesis lipoprotein
LAVDSRLALLLAAALLAACQSEPQAYQFQGSTMGTTYSITLARLPEGLSEQQLQREFDDRLAGLNGEMSTYLEDSTISRFNRANDSDWFAVSAAFVELSRTALELSRLSDGAYDITAAPLIELWGFGSDRKLDDRVPTDAEIASARARTGYDRFELRATPPAIRKLDPRLTIDLSSIAKGYAVDVLAEYLASLGLRDFLVEIGGELRASGRSHRGDQWRIVIEKPVSGGRSVQRVIEIEDTGVATSGDYRNYFEENGIRYSHIIDAKTGKPITHALASVTVLDATAMRADGWATVLLLLGEEVGYELAARQEIAAFFVVAQAAGFSTRETAKFTRLTGGAQTSEQL